MPELPEVENLRRGLDKKLRGRKIHSVKVGKPRIVSGKGSMRPASTSKAKNFSRALTGDIFVDVKRRAKNIVFELESGAVIVAHLKMSGQFAYVSPEKIIGGHPIQLSEIELPNKHTHIIFELDKGVLYYNDIRMFGYVLWYPSIEAATKAHFKNLGVEPLEPEFTLKYFRDSLAKTSAKLKSVLMGQSLVTGLGNIYVDEACFVAGIRPDRVAKSLTSSETKKLHVAIKKILKKAIEAGGSSVATYRLLDMSRGNYAREHKVYGRAGKACLICGRRLQKTTIQSRTTVFCSSCQK